MLKNSILFNLSIILLFSNITRAQWNLPYLRPATYDYSSYYSQDLADYVKSRPTALPNEMKKAWNFFKKTFIMSNGLVNHSRWDNDRQNIVGTGDAVSEGQGYGLLLAVLMNDQTTFNKIYKAANQYLWTGRSYKWDWKHGNGSATDADLDIGLALVFADALVKGKMWDGGTDYHSQAIKVIESIKNTMTSGGYLLPGDSWGGGAADKQNTSYYSLAALKIFNDYHNSVNFKQVIDNCYNVLKKAPRYSLGQTPNWMTRNGGRTSPGNVSDGNVYGMGNDAIRTPWRIAMDAMWFNDARAKAYCANTKKTLSNYANTNWKTYVGQMGFYNENGGIVKGTGGYPETTAMWSCGILGSQDKSYTTKGLRLAVVTRVTGTPADFFGAAELKDHYFYYKQAVSMLGFAFFTGQFPNVWADYKSGNMKPKPDGVDVVQSIKASIVRISFPTKVKITAKLQKAADWTITITGIDSKTKKTYTGNSADISVEWDGTGFTKSEYVEAVLSGSAINSDDPSKITVKMYISSPWNNSMSVTPKNLLWPQNSGRLIQASYAGNLLRIGTVQKAITPVFIKIMELDGSSIFQTSGIQKINDNHWHVNLQNTLQNGLYLLSVKFKNANNSSATQRILIHR